MCVKYNDKYDDKYTYDKYRMICMGNLKIFYKRVIETDAARPEGGGGATGPDSISATGPDVNEIVFDCSRLTKEDIFKNKYFKYKNKYLQLKNKYLQLKNK